MTKEQMIMSQLQRIYQMKMQVVMIQNEMKKFDELVAHEKSYGAPQEVLLGLSEIEDYLVQTGDVKNLIKEEDFNVKN